MKNQNITFLLIGTLCLTSLTGCVRRRLTVRTSPPGAMVYVDRQPIGMTPVSTNFTYYGTRHFEIVKDGYRTEKFLRRFNPPWYEFPGVAFVSETLWPFEKRDERVVDVQMSVDPVFATEAIIASGQELRDQSRMGVAITSPPPLAPLGAPITVPSTSPSDFPTNNGLINADPTNPDNSSPFTFPIPNRIPATEVTPGGSFRPVEGYQ